MRFSSFHRSSGVPEFRQPNSCIHKSQPIRWFSDPKKKVTDDFINDFMKRKNNQDQQASDPPEYQNFLNDLVDSMHSSTNMNIKVPNKPDPLYSGSVTSSNQRIPGRATKDEINELFTLHAKDPLEWNAEKLALKFHLDKMLVYDILHYNKG